MNMQITQTVKNAEALPKKLQKAFEGITEKEKRQASEAVKQEKKPVYQTYIYRSYGGGYQGL